MLHWNIQSVIGKAENIELVIKEQNADFCITEHWCSIEEIALFNFAQFSCWHNSKSHVSTGG